MKIGFLSDAHGNIQGLVSCLDKLQQEGAEQIYFLGDAIGYLPSGQHVIAELLKRKIPGLLGNHEAMVTGLLAVPAGKNEIYRLSRLDSDIIPGWPQTLTVTLDHKSILLVHGRPADPLNGYCYEDQCLEPSEIAEYEVVVMGHTHHPYIKNEGNVLLINDGSCGLPRDGKQQLSCALYDTVSGQADILRISFDFKELLDSFTPGTVAEEVVNKLLKG